MPLTKIEHSSNIKITASQIQGFFEQLHQTLVDVIGTDIGSCRSWVVPTGEFCIAQGANDQGFMIMTMQILPGRSAEVKQQLQEAASDLMHQLLKSIDQKPANIGVRVILQEADLANYHMSDFGID